ncbi:hypothetical protein GCM10023085_81280 [Actinomadura viridis]|uniref:Drug/metabolite transporter (DMT)-like permease n=1 Tax=Actinomadura viridis TaxID=58110 RepID=A0A931DH28_9ACTN|nr:DMT family transporter [Actinomadura viridis]MBG6088107.1 drug/metabolite transporter (DMT)-like permease [Actinomadura viridis]
MAGLGLGFGGVLVTVRIWECLAGSTLTGILACLGAAVCLGAGFAYTRRFFSGRPGSAAALTGVQLTCATVQLAAATAATGALPGRPGAAAIIALGGLGALGTGFAFLLNLRLIRTAGPTIASCVTYLVPLWSTLIGALLLDEPWGWSLVAGGLLVVLGVFLVQSSPRRPPVPARTTPPLPAVPEGR